MQRCDACNGWVHYPRTRCSHCLSDRLSWHELGGTGTVYTFSVARQPTTAAFLAEVLYRQGRDDEALAMTEQSEEIAAADDVATQYLWRSVRAKLVARRGSFAEAEALALDAIRIIEAAQDPDSQGYAYIDLAEVLRMAGRADEAIRAADEAAARFDQKGNTESAARARRLKAEIQATPTVR